MPNLSGTYLNLDFELSKLQKIELLIHTLNNHFLELFPVLLQKLHQSI